MIKNKKAEVSQIFTYISTGIVIVIILGFGFNWLMNLLGNVSDVECIQFKKNLELKVRNNIEFGKVDARPIRVNCDFRQICFTTDPMFQSVSVDGNNFPIINNSLTSRAKQNVFFINHIPESFFYLEKLVVDSNIQCFNVTNLGLDIRLEGKGNHVFLSRNE